MSDEFDSGVTKAEAELLALLIEECGETIQAATKVLRHGWESRNPLDSDSLTNRENLAKELGHIECAGGLICEGRGCINYMDVIQARSNKIRSIKRWLHHNKDIAP